MANIKSQIKRIKTNEKARQRNKAVKSALRTHTRRFREAAAAGEAEKAQEYAKAANRALDKAASQGRHPQEPGGEPQVGHRRSGCRAGLTRPSAASTARGATRRSSPYCVPITTGDRDAVRYG